MEINDLMKYYKVYKDPHCDLNYISLSHWGLHSTNTDDYVSYNFMEKYL